MIYHVFNKSIADYVIFNTDSEYMRFIEDIKFYSSKNNNGLGSKIFKINIKKEKGNEIF
ncbi:MAG: hypothetical protein K6357_02995 [Elusimicrobiota bacterium]